MSDFFIQETCLGSSSRTIPTYSFELPRPYESEEGVLPKGKGMY